MKIVFAGDSITDCGRNRRDSASLGDGYVRMIAKSLGDRAEVLNRGVSGDRAQDLAARWQGDVLDARPDWISILIGINDTWRIFDSGLPSPLDAFEKDVFLMVISAQMNDAGVVLCTPFLAPDDDQAKWLPDVSERVSAIQRVGAQTGAYVVPSHALFTASNRLPMAPDGVHPSDDGHRLLADTWFGWFEKVSPPC